MPQIGDTLYLKSGGRGVTVMAVREDGTIDIAWIPRLRSSQGWSIS